MAGEGATCCPGWGCRGTASRLAFLGGRRQKIPRKESKSKRLIGILTAHGSCVSVMSHSQESQVFH